MVAGQSTRGPGTSEAASLTESVAAQVELSTPPGDEAIVGVGAPLGRSAPVANDDAEFASPRGFDDSGPPLPLPLRRARPLRFKPPRRASRVFAPALALRI